MFSYVFYIVFELFQSFKAWLLFVRVSLLPAGSAGVVLHVGAGYVLL